MNKKNITPNPQQPVDRVPTGQLPTLLAELDEATLSSTHTLPSSEEKGYEHPLAAFGLCSYDGEDD